jgi:aspartate/methionine/tyrosine aminotransferase
LTFGLDGLSKLLAAPQLKLGWIRLSGPASARREVADALDAIADAYLAVSQPVALALPALLEHADASVARVCARINTNYAALTSLFTGDGFSVRAAQGGWMALVDVPPTRQDEDPALVALREAHLYVHPGWFYDLDSDHTLAVSLLPEPAAFVSHTRRLKEALQLG